MAVAQAVAKSHGANQAPALDGQNAWAAALSSLGVLDQPDTTETVYLWPDNVQAWNCWQGVQTQWRTGMSGPTGLDYAGVRAFLGMQDLEINEQREAFVGIQACERVTLDVWAEQRNRTGDN